MLAIRRCRKFPINSRWNHSGEKKENKIHIIKLYKDKESKELDRFCTKSLQPISKPCPQFKISTEKVFDFVKRLSVRSQINTKTMLEKMNLPENAKKYKDEVIIPKINEKFKRESLLKKFNELKGSQESFNISAREISNKTYESTKIIACQAYHRWNIFLKSETGMKIEKLILSISQTSWKLIVQIYKFIYECYFMKSTKKSEKHH